MPGTSDELRLDPIPASVGRARAMVASRLREVGREDLVDNAELVVSEVVTNALLHAGAPITIRVRGTRRHPRVEVADRSMGLPRLPESLPEPVGALPELTTVGAAAGPSRSGGVRGPRPSEAVADVDLDALTTGGRGVGLVITHSASWGVDRSSHGKVIWFEPSAEVRTDARNEIQVFETVDAEPQRTPFAEHADGETTSPVRLINAPVRAIAAVRRHYDELQREIRLIGLQYGGRASSLPKQFFVQAANPDLHRLRAVGSEQVQDAVERGLEYTDLDYKVTQSAAEEFAETVRLLLAADAFCRREHLLTLAMSDRQLAVVGWFLDQIVSQLDGLPPVPWTEPTAASG